MDYCFGGGKKFFLLSHNKAVAEKFSYNECVWHRLIGVDKAVKRCIFFIKSHIHREYDLGTRIIILKT